MSFVRITQPRLSRFLRYEDAAGAPHVDGVSEGAPIPKYVRLWLSYQLDNDVPPESDPIIGNFVNAQPQERPTGWGGGNGCVFVRNESSQSLTLRFRDQNGPVGQPLVIPPGETAFNANQVKSFTGWDGPGGRSISFDVS